LCGQSVIITKYCAGDKIEKNEIGCACGKYEGRERCAQGVGGRIILKWILRKWEGVVGTEWSWLRIGTDGGRL
jgi:hypothetical protein